ncbi:MAG: hypothetical protein ACTSP4_00040 [Candidatus Hodarchaeales archaeon]
MESKCVNCQKISAADEGICPFCALDKDTLDINRFAQTIRLVNKNNGWNVLNVNEWNDAYKIPSLLALIHSEISEALEAFRKQDFDNFKEELVDTIIRILDLASAFPAFNIQAELIKKVEKNRLRGYRHGNKKV